LLTLAEQVHFGLSGFEYGKGQYAISIPDLSPGCGSSRNGITPAAARATF
jgi:hypothetical protein